MRLALCGNVFPADSAAEVLAQLAGPVTEWAARLRAEGYSHKPGFGLYLSARTASAFANDADLQEQLAAAVDAAGVEVWTANAFPYGGFHDTLVKEKAFAPDWREPSRLQFTKDVASVLVELMPSGSEGSLSTCPLGYGRTADAEQSWQHLTEATHFLAKLHQQTGVKLTLAIEPEPDGAFERVDTLAEAILAHFQDNNPYLGICWDLCHSAVVGESASEVLAAMRKTGVPIGKVQVSSAMRLDGPLLPPARAELERYAADPWFHQTRAHDAANACPMAWPDLPHALSDPNAIDAIAWRVHCHVPLHLDQLSGGWQTTAWRPSVREAVAAGITDFECETYTLPHLLDKIGPRSTLVETLVEESLASARVLGIFPAGD